MLANNIYNKTRVKNSEILELLIYSAYIEEQKQLDEYEQNTFKEVITYYYQEGQKEVDKTRKPSMIPEIILATILSMPNAKGYIWKDYKETITKYNSEQIYRQATIDLQQQKELDITNDIYQNIIKRQNNSRLNINGDKISGDVDLTLIGMNNRAKMEGIYSLDENSRVKFISVNDEKRTRMCESLEGQIFNVHDWNEFKRYSKANDSIVKYRCYGLVTGLNLPPIDDGFHWCRSTIMYIKPVDKQDQNWYNRLGNSNKNGIGGSGKGIFIEKIKPGEIPDKLKQYEEDIRNMSIEYAVVIDENGNVYTYQGTSTNLDIKDRKLDNAILTHNHPEIGAFGEDDFAMLKDNQKLKELRAVDKKYNYKLNLLKPLNITYNEIYIEGLQLHCDSGEELQHCVMEVLKKRGYVNYERRRKG